MRVVRVLSLVEPAAVGCELVGVQALGLACLDEGGRGLGDRVERAVAAGGADGLEACGEVVGVAFVEPAAHDVGEVGAYLAFAPGARLGCELVDDQGWVPDRFGPAVGARMDGDHGVVVRVVQRDAVPAGRHQHAAPLPAAAGLVVVGRELNAPVFARLAVVSGHGVERLGRQRHQRVSVVCETFRHARAGDRRTHSRRRQCLATFQQQARELLERLGRGLGHHEIAPQVVDRVLHVALLVARVRVAETHLHAMMRDERGEHTRERHITVAVASSGAGGIVHHQHRGNPAHALEHHQQTLTQAFGVLPGHRHRVAHVRVWQRGHQEMHRALHTGHVCQGDAEIDLHHARIPLKTQIPVRAFPVRLAPFLHVAAHHAVRAVEPVLGHQPVEHPLDPMPLLARHHPIRLQPLVDHMLERIRLAPEPPVLFGLGVSLSVCQVVSA